MTKEHTNNEQILEEETNDNNPALASIVKALEGSFNAPDSFDYKDELTKALHDKYLNEARE